MVRIPKPRGFHPRKPRKTPKLAMKAPKLPEPVRVGKAPTLPKKPAKGQLKPPDLY
jgi:hypothetical protein